MILGSLGLTVFRRQLINWLVYLNIFHGVLIGLTIFTIVVPITKLLTSSELYDFVYHNVWHYFIFITLTLFQCVSLIINIIVWKQTSQFKQKSDKEEIPLSELYSVE